jgi:hypothetical protein
MNARIERAINYDKLASESCKTSSGSKDMSFGSFKGKIVFSSGSGEL